MTQLVDLVDQQSPADDEGPQGTWYDVQGNDAEQRKFPSGMEHHLYCLRMDTPLYDTIRLWDVAWNGLFQKRSPPNNPFHPRERALVPKFGNDWKTLCDDSFVCDAIVVDFMKDLSAMSGNGFLSRPATHADPTRARIIMIDPQFLPRLLDNYDGPITNWNYYFLGVEKWFGKSDVLTAHDWCFLPVNMPNYHWYLIVADFRKKRFLQLDSLYKRRASTMELTAHAQAVVEHFKHFCNDFLRKFQTPQQDWSQWRSIRMLVDSQSDCSCALLLMLHMDGLTRIPMDNLYDCEPPPCPLLDCCGNQGNGRIRSPWMFQETLH